MADVFKAKSGDWKNGANWSDGAPPGSFVFPEDATFDSGAVVTVSDTEAVANVSTGSAAPTITIEASGILGLSAGISSSSTFDLSSGTLNLAGTLTGTVGSANVLKLDGGVLSAQGGSLQELTVQGTLDLSAADASLVAFHVAVTSATAGQPGLIALTGANAELEIGATETMSNVSIQFGSASASSPSVLSIDSRQTLTLAQSSIVIGSAGAGANALISGAGKFVLGAGSSIVDPDTSKPGSNNLTIATAGGFENDATVQSGYASLVSTAITGTGTIDLTGTLAFLNLTSTVSSGQNIAFGTADQTLELGAVTVVTPTAVAASITGLAGGGRDVFLNNVGYTATMSGSVLGGLLRIVDGTTIDAILNTPDIADGTAVTIASDGSGTMVTVACYCPGTLIRTATGETPVERLAIGDVVATVSGALEPVRWIGCRSYRGRFLLGRRELWPVRIAAGALGEGLPRRDLLISPDHAMLIDGVLVAARHLVNGTTVTRKAPGAEVHYIHIELDQHDAIWAEGAASETFADDESRGMFQTSQGTAAPSRPPRYCAPRVSDGPMLLAIRARLDGVFVHAA